MAWYITDGVLQKANNAPAANSILTDITGKGDVVIPSGVTSIGDKAFSYCAGLTSITIPDSVTSIGNEAFYSCYRLTDITLLRGVTGIGDKAFYECASLKGITFPDSVASIGKRAFYLCSRLTDLTIPDSVASIGNEAFSQCKRLTNITIPGSSTSIGDEAFSWCESLTGVTIPNSVISLGKKVFGECSKLTQIALPGHLMGSLDKNFRNQLKELRCSGNVGKVPAALRPTVFAAFAQHESEYSQELHTEHITVLKKSVEKLVGAAFDCPELLYLMCREKLIPAKSVDIFTQEAVKRENVELTAVILDYQNRILGMEEVSKARERKEKIRGQQDEVVIDRMAARADKRGIDGLNFAAAGGLNHFAKRDDLKKYIAERGGRLMSAMSAKIDYLITNDTDGGSEKNKKAADLGIIVISEDEFLKMAEGKE